MNTVRARELLDIIENAQSELSRMFSGIGSVEAAAEPIEKILTKLPVGGEPLSHNKILKDLQTMKPKAVAEKYNMDLKEIYKIKYAAKREAKRGGDKRGTGWSEKECCGSRGATHKRTCENYRPTTRKKYEMKPFAVAEPELTQDAGQLKARPLSGEEYAELRSAMNDPKFQSIIHASSQKLSLREVNKAIRSTNYQEYIDDI
jgi:hypothetical protein